MNSRRPLTRCRPFSQKPDMGSRRQILIRTKVIALTLPTALLLGGMVAAAPSASACTDTVKILINGLNIRTGAGTSYASEGLLYKGDTGKVIDVKGDKPWTKISLLKKSKTGLAKGTSGWVYEGKLQENLDWYCS